MSECDRGGSCPTCNGRSSMLDEDVLKCPTCGKVTKDGKKCPECQALSDDALGVEER